MELKDILKERHSVRRYKSVDIPESDLENIILSAGQAPSGKNIQNWHFIVIKKKELINKIGETLASKNEEIALKMDQKSLEKGHAFRKFAKGFTLFFLNAPVLILVYTTTYYPSGYHELVYIDAGSDILDQLLLQKNPGMQNLGAALENLTLSAIDHGYGTCWLTSANYASTEIENLIKMETGFSKEGYFMGAMMTLGIPDGLQKSPPKKSLSDIYTLIK